MSAGLSTRDATLREELPKTSELHFAAFDLECKAVSQNTSALVYALSPRGDGEPKAVWEWKFPCDLNDPETIAKLAEECEHLSRGELKTVLERAGLGKSVPAARATAAVPVQAEEQLGNSTNSACWMGCGGFMKRSDPEENRPNC